MAGTQRDPRFNIGMQTDWRGQQYELLTIEPCKRQGRDSLVLTWRANCAKCGAPFTTTTAQWKIQYPRRCCPTCH